MTQHGPVLVLGSTGFIGSAIVRGLRERAIPVYALGRSERAGTDKGVVRLRGSVEDSALIHEALEQCAHVVYCASQTTPATSARDPAMEVVGNLLPLARLLEHAHDFPKRNIVYLSSGGTVYGDAARDADESIMPQPRSYYGAGKTAAEAFLHACAKGSDWSVTVLRPTNPYGPGQAIMKAFAIVPTLFARALDSDTFPIWGDGSIVRDYCYIDDLVCAVVATLGSGSGSRYEVYNVSGGEAISIIELVRFCELVSERTIRVEFLPERAIDVAHVSPSHGALTAATGWKPAVPLREGLVLTWDSLTGVRALSHNR